jgi:rhodanese-related sulfurtransferase
MLDYRGPPEMILALIIVAIAVALGVAYWLKRAADRRQLDLYSITPEALYALREANKETLVFDVRVPLDLLVDSEIIPGSIRVSPREILENPKLIPQDKDAIVYCTCPSQRTSRSVLRKALAMKFSRIKVLAGGLDGWKAKGYPVEPYTRSFHLDTAG